MSNRSLALAGLALAALLAATRAEAQPTYFAYEGRLNDNGSPASGSYDLTFKLFDVDGNQIGADQTFSPVAVTGGAFTVKLDFGAAAFPGDERFLELSVKKTGTPTYTTLAPRTPLGSAPYSRRAAEAALADGLSPAGSGGFIQNGNAPQAADFNVTGSGTAGALATNATVDFSGTGAPAASGAGQGRVYFDSGSNKLRVSENGGDFADLVGAGGVSGSGTVNRFALWSGGTSLTTSSVILLPNGNIGIGTTTPQSKLDIAAQDALSMTGYQPGLTFRDTNVSKRSVIQGANGDLGFIPNSFIGVTAAMVVKDNGNVGIGTTSPVSKLEIAAQDALSMTGYQPGLTFRDTSSSKRSVIQGANGDIGLIPDSFIGNTAAMVVKNSGNVGIGTTSPGSPLVVQGTVDPLVQLNHLGSGGSPALWLNQDGNAKAYLYYDRAGDRFNLGTPSANPTISMGTDGKVGIGTTAPDRKLHVQGDVYASGNAAQARASFGLPKAMAHIGPSNTINRCYNAITNSTTPPCGFSVSGNTGDYLVDFGFQVNDRFFVVTPSLDPGGYNTGANAYVSSTNAIHVFTFYTDDRHYLTNTDFMIVVF